MTNTTAIGFEMLLAAAFAQVIQDYGLRVKPFDDAEAFLIGKDYVLDFAADREGVECRKTQLMSLE